VGAGFRIEVKVLFKDTNGGKGGRVIGTWKNYKTIGSGDGGG